MWVRKRMNVGVKSLSRQVGMASGAERRGLSLYRSMDGSPTLGTWKAELRAQVQVGGGSRGGALELIFCRLLFS